MSAYAEGLVATADPLLDHPHAKARVCAACAARIEVVCDAIVGDLAESMTEVRHAQAGAAVCDRALSRSAAWALIARLDDAGVWAARHAYEHLAGKIEAGALPRVRGPLGDPLVSLLVTPVTNEDGLIPAENLEAMAIGLGHVQGYLTRRAAARLADVGDLGDKAGAELARYSRVIGLAVLALAAAAVAVMAGHEGTGTDEQPSQWTTPDGATPRPRPGTET